MVQNADLMIGLVINQLSQRSLDIGITVYISLNSINDSVVSYSTLNDIKTLPRLFASPTINDKVEPLLVVSFKALYVIAFRQRELISVYYSLFCSSYGLDTHSPFGSLLKQRRKIKAGTEIQVFSADAYQRLLNNNSRTMI